MENVVCEVCIIVSECAANVIAFVSAALDELLKFRNNYVIAAANSIMSSSTSMPFVVSVKRKFLLCCFSMLLA